MTEYIALKQGESIFNSERFFRDKPVRKETIKRLEYLTKEQLQDIKKTYRQMAYRARKRGQKVINPDTLINIIINRIE